jgi:hypothetical protein
VHELDPQAPPPTPVVLDGVPLNDVALGAVDLYYGRVDGDLVLTNDSALDLKPARALEPKGLPPATTAWLYVDAEKAPAALRSLATLAGTTFSPQLLAELQGLRSVLVFVTQTRSTTSVTVTVQPSD